MLRAASLAASTSQRTVRRFVALRFLGSILTGDLNCRSRVRLCASADWVHHPPSGALTQVSTLLLFDFSQSDCNVLLLTCPAITASATSQVQENAAAQPAVPKHLRLNLRMEGVDHTVLDSFVELCRRTAKGRCTVYTKSCRCTLYDNRVSFALHTCMAVVLKSTSAPLLSVK